MTRTQMLAKIADAHRDWSPHDGQTTDLSMWQADRSAPPAVDDELNEQIKAILAEGYDEDEPLPDIPDD